MGEFFRGWRRKTGCGLLVVACFLCGAWLRSDRTIDWVSFPGKDDTELSLFSGDSGLGWQRTLDDPSTRKFNFHSFPFQRSQVDQNVKWHWRYLGFGSAETSNTKFWVIPYWAIVIPLTLFSAYLLIGKPPVATPKKIVEPTSAAGG